MSAPRPGTDDGEVGLETGDSEFEGGTEEIEGHGGPDGIESEDMRLEDQELANTLTDDGAFS
jgi:hypothetical protein